MSNNFNEFQQKTGSKVPLNDLNPVHRCNLNLQEHLKYVDSLVLLKIIDKQTGESIKQNMAASFNKNNGLSASTGLNPLQESQYNFNNQQNPSGKRSIDISQSEFLKARECLLNYLQNLDIELDEGDLRNIEAVVLELEKGALARRQEQGGTNALELLNKNNEIAKERLMTGSLNNLKVYNQPEKLFSRDEIAKMSTAEFIKNEPIINYQLQNGLL